ncbi:MAG TPA: phospholipase D-like domain-containing protein [Acidobacteriaceae bacterium]|nr:phospholipase D-like domain-containing protein [Acidobacteriaceae bacterium]
MKLFVQPEAGLDPILHTLRKAKKSIQILIFRLDRPEIEKALVEAVERGVAVQVLVAYTNRGGDKVLRRFEMRMLERGVTVTRTADDLVRYHGKMIIIDGKELLLMAFNFTHLDISMSRSFAISTMDKKVVTEAIKLFECDSKRTQYTAGCNDFVVSPVNARARLTEFIRGAKKQLLMYEMKISDHDFVKLLNDKVSEGVDVRVIGSTTSKGSTLPARKLPMRLHARAILCDGRSAFVGSQSLRKLELEARRELGMIIHNPKVVKEMTEVFDKDWREATPAAQPSEMANLVRVPAKKVAKKVAKELNVGSTVERVLDRALEKADDAGLEPKELAESVRDAMREEVQEAVTNALHELVTAAANAPTEETPSPTKESK